jgi:hypothetical protein
MDTRGTEIQVRIKLNVNDDDGEYIDIVSELQDKIVDTIESLGHEFIICSSKPIDISDIEE